VPGGGISPDGKRWKFCRRSFLLPVKVLGSLFRKKFLIYLREAHRKGRMKFHGEMAGLASPASFEALCRKAGRTPWVVFVKAPFGGPEQVLKYLARYTHRVAISNSRILSMEDGRITFLWKDYAGGNKTRTMTLDAAEFIRRFLLHILPSGFVRIRQFGFLANRVRKEKLVLCRKLLFTSAIGITGCVAAKDLKRCPVCKVGNMIRIGLHYQADRLIVMHQHDSS
jgi:hypothetical protein